MDNIYVGYEWGSIGCLWVSGYVSLWWCGRVNAKTKSLMGNGLFMIDYEAFMGLGCAKKGKGMSKAKWVWAKGNDLWVGES